jgi:predicted RNA binding protein YcfA (HicA-like mRNA interferase family)
MPLPRQTPLRELIRKLVARGFVGPYGGGKHPFMKKGRLKVRIPNPHGSDIGIELLGRILRQAGISEEEWMPPYCFF